MKTQIIPGLLLLLLAVNQALAFDANRMAWGIRNTGADINVYINPKQTYTLQARPNEDINLAPALTGRKVKVAVLDTGIDLENVTLNPYIITNSNKCEAYQKLKECIAEKNSDLEKCRKEHLQAPENVYPADCHGWSIINSKVANTPNNIIGRPDFSDPAGHGTHVAGIVAAVTKNVEIIPVQVIGVGPNQPIKPFSIDLSPNENVRKGFQGDMLSEKISRGIIYAINAGAEVINMSIGWPENQNTDIIKEAIAAAQKRGIIIVAAAGNDSTGALLRPCQYKGVICVAAHAPDGSIASFSNFGFGVDIAAPGVEIISTIPYSKRSSRLPGVRGFDLLSGTSQAAPFVTGVIAEMLSRGIPATEIYPRLILGAREVKNDLPVLVGPNRSRAQKVDASTKYDKTVLSGLLDMSEALKANPQTLILPADKDIAVINWDRKSADLKFTLELKNYWKSFSGRNVNVTLKPLINSSVDPVVAAVEPLDNMAQWTQGEEKRFNVKLKIVDNADAGLSRLPSDLSYMVTVTIDGIVHRRFQVDAEVLVGVSEALTDADVMKYEFKGQIPRGMKLSLVDEIYDTNKAQRDYFLLGSDEENGSLSIALVRNQGNIYQVEKEQQIKFDGKIKLIRSQYKIRIDIDADGVSEYIYGIIEYLDEKKTVYGDYINHFYIFDNNMKLKSYVKYDDKRAAMPYTFYWMKVGGKMRPAWVGVGQEVVKKWDITDLWSTDGSPEEVAAKVRSKSDIHFYFLNEVFKLDQVPALKGEERIVDVVQTGYQNIMNGIITVLIAKNMGTENSPSYINEFSIANIQNGKLSAQVNLKSIGPGIEYRNLVDTYAVKTMNLLSEASEFRGMMWYGLDAGDRQRVTMLDVESKQMVDKLISSQRKVHDSALLVKSGFQSPGRKGVFLITNSELEYHDLINDGVVSRSLNRYTFLGDSNYVEFFFPITLLDRNNPTQKTPALFTTEQAALSKGIRMIAPVYDEQGRLEKMVTPARLRLKSETGCRPLEAPVYLGDRSGFAMDYKCSDKILRFLLKY